MATGEKNDNTDEYCFPPELLAKNNTDLQDYTVNKIKSQQKLKDLLTQSDSDNKPDTLQKDIKVTKQTKLPVLCDNIFNSCVRENVNTIVSNRLDLNTVSKSVNSSKGTSWLTSKVNSSLSDSTNELNYGPYRQPISASPPTISKGSDRGINSNNNQTHNSHVFRKAIHEESARGVSNPPLAERVLTSGDDVRLSTPGLYEDANDFLFQDNSYDTPITARFETEDEWEMALHPGSSRSPLPTGNLTKPVTHTLFIRQAGTMDTLRQQITQTLGGSEMTVLDLEDSFDVGTKADMYSLIWFHLLTPIRKRAIEIMSMLKSSGRNNILPIVVTNNPIKDKLPIQADLFVEPLTDDTVERLCSTVKATIVKNTSHVSSKQQTNVHNSASTPESTISSASGRTSTGNHSPPRWCRMEHATKEKQRRERIKDSCDQLRVLLPYVKGRKTDMASILEMTVDYLKIVNSALSQDFHSQVIDIMSNGSPPVEDDYFSMNMAYKKTIRKEEDGMDLDASSAKSFHTVLTKTETKASKTSKKVNLNVNNRMVTRSVSRSLTSMGDEMSGPDNDDLHTCRNAYSNVNNRIIVTKRGCSTTKIGSSNPKKPYTAMPAQEKQSRTVNASSTSVLKDYKTENTADDQTSQKHSQPSVHFPHMFTDGDISANRMFSSGHVASNDGFAYISHSQINLQSTHNSSGDRNDVNNYSNVYFDSPYMPYSYSNLQDSNNGNYYGTEYVNPNAVLPVTSYMPRVSAFASGRKFERSSSSNVEMLQCDSDSYNNNTL